MTNADSSSPIASRTTRLARTQQSLFRGSVDGRVRQAAPIPGKAPSDAEQLKVLFVGDDDPGITSGYLFWFDTDEPV